MTNDKRQHTRFDITVGAEIVANGETYSATTQNLSEGGVGVTTRAALPEDLAVEVTLFLTQDGIEDPDAPPFEARATVMWAAENDSGEHAAGLRFGQLGTDQATALKQFLEQLGSSS